jgi:hypothetical protein
MNEDNDNIVERYRERREMEENWKERSLLMAAHFLLLMDD